MEKEATIQNEQSKNSLVRALFFMAGTITLILGVIDFVIGLVLYNLASLFSFIWVFF